MTPQSLSTSSILILVLFSLYCISHAHYSPRKHHETLPSPLHHKNKKHADHKDHVPKGSDSRSNPAHVAHSHKEAAEAASIASSNHRGPDQKKDGPYPPYYRCVGILGVCGVTFSKERCSQLCYDYYSNDHPSPHCDQYPGSEYAFCYCEHDCLKKKP